MGNREFLDYKGGYGKRTLPASCWRKKQNCTKLYTFGVGGSMPDKRRLFRGGKGQFGENLLLLSCLIEKARHFGRLSPSVSKSEGFFIGGIKVYVRGGDLGIVSRLCYCYLPSSFDFLPIHFNFPHLHHASILMRVKENCLDSHYCLGGGVFLPDDNGDVTEVGVDFVE